LKEFRLPENVIPGAIEFIHYLAQLPYRNALLVILDAVQSPMGKTNFARKNADGFVASFLPQVVSKKPVVQMHPGEAERKSVTDA
jgi:hypothetical protein